MLGLKPSQPIQERTRQGTTHMFESLHDFQLLRDFGDGVAVFQVYISLHFFHREHLSVAAPSHLEDVCKSSFADFPSHLVIFTAIPLHAMIIRFSASHKVVFGLVRDLLNPEDISEWKDRRLPCC